MTYRSQTYNISFMTKFIAYDNKFWDPNQNLRGFETYILSRLIIEIRSGLANSNRFACVDNLIIRPLNNYSLM